MKEDCPSLERLDRHVSGVGEPGDSEGLDRHVSRCPACRSMVVRLGAQSGLAARLKSLRNVLGEALASEPVAVEPSWSPEGYDIIAEIHRGGQGIVYEAVQRTTGRRVAIKVLRPDRVHSERARLRLEREFELIRDLAHPNVVRLYDSGRAGERRFLVMEHIDGQHLDDWARSERPSTKEVLILFGKICRAVQHAHQRGVIHRDLKPRNVLVDAMGEPHVLDFGVARVVEPEKDGLAITGVDEFAGTLPYASPEQIGGDPDAVDIRTDVYSLGVLLYQLLTGVHPFAEFSSIQALVGAISTVEPPPPSRFMRRGEGDLDAIVAKAMAKDRHRRYQSAQSLHDDLARHQANDPVEARRGTRWYVLRKTLVRYRVVVSFVALLMVVLAVFASVAFRLWREAERTATEAREATSAAQRELALRRKVSDVKTARELIEASSSLYPISEDLVPACEAWLARARPVLEQRDSHRRELARIRERSEPFTRERRAAAHPLAFDQLLALERRIAEAVATDAEGAILLALSAEKDALEEQFQRRRRWIYADPELAWLDELLVELLGRIDVLETLVAEVEARAERSRTLRQRTIAAESEAWSRAAKAVEMDSRFPGVELSPQVGLVPLGPDPVTGLQEFWHVESGERPSRDPTTQRYSLLAQTGIVLVLVPGGRARLGCVLALNDADLGPHEDPFATDDCAPVHTVDLDPFFLSKYEMTRGQWRAIHGEAPEGGFSRRGLQAPQPLTDAHPVANVDWFQAESTLESFGLLLPTEAQWEYAARAGSSSRWFTGNSFASLEGYGNVLDSGQWPTGTIATVQPTPDLDDGERYLAVVGRYRGNAFGVHDLVGNVKEWCADWVIEYAVASARPGDGLRLSLDHYGRRVLRGGSCALRAEWGGSGIRDHLEPDHTDNYGGIRAARSLDR